MIDRYADFSDRWSLEDRTADALFQSRKIPLLGNRVRTISRYPIKRPAFTGLIGFHAHPLLESGREDFIANHAMVAFDVGNVA